MASYMDVIKEKIVIFDGATGTNIQKLLLTAEDFGGALLEGCNEILVDTRPDVIKNLHASFLEVGVDAIETNTFGDLPFVLGEYGLADKAYDLAFEAAKLAKGVANDYSSSSHPRFVAGSMGPGTKSPTLAQISFSELRDAYEILAKGLIDGGVDVLLVETTFDILAAKAAIIGSRAAMAKTRKVPIQIQVTIELTGRMLLGTEVSSALNAIEAMKPDVIGINCATGPVEMYEAVRYLCENTSLPISIMPNAGLPSVKDGHMHYDLTPEELATHLHHFATEFGVNVIGGCCGTTPEHMQQVVEACGNLPRKQRLNQEEKGVSSIYSFVPYSQDNSVLMVGEKTNANGSKRFREAMLEKDFETTTQIAKEQVKEGAHVIDVCVDYTGADGVANMAAIAERISTQATTPIMVDSTEAPVIEKALQLLGGKCIINSVNLEEGKEKGTRLDSFLSLAAEYGAAVVCTCIDEEGQARTASWKLRAAQAIYDIAVNEYGIDPADLFFDPLALPLSTGMEESRKDGLETIEAIRLIKEKMPDCHTILGLSNISFGLNPALRQVLNSVFLDEAVSAGLDSAIVNAAKIVPLHKIDEEQKNTCLDLIYDRRTPDYDPLAKLIEIFQDAKSSTAQEEDRSDWPVDKRLKHRIIDGDSRNIQDDLKEALDSGISAISIINDTLLNGMKVVGDLFGSGKMQLPFVLQSAETMKAAVSFLEPFMEKTESSDRGKIVLATVKGDVHDIGKNLVDIILSNNGYKVANLGIKVPLSVMLEEAEKINADAIGMSGLLVKSTLIMKENLEELNRLGKHDIPVLLGGAALTRTYVEKDLRGVYQGRVFYGKDAFEGLDTLSQIMEHKQNGDSDEEFGRKPSGRQLPKRKSELDAEFIPGDLPPRSPAVKSDNEIFTPPFIGSRVAKGIALDEIVAYLNETALFRNQWGYRPENGETDLEFKSRVRSELRMRLDEAKANGVLIPQVVWGYYPANSDGDKVIVFRDETRTEIATTFSFPRQKKDPFLCIADFFKSQEEGPDYIGLIVVSMGEKASVVAKKYFDDNKYLDYVQLHGLSVETTEALMELWHYRMRQEWGFADQDGPTLTGLFRQQYRGGRYSFGYPACPDLGDNAKVVQVLQAGRIGVSLSEEDQLEPEQTTLAIVCHHPQAKYFVA